MLNRGDPIEVVAKRVSTSVSVIRRHYDQPDAMEEMEERQREYLDRLNFSEEGSER